MNAIDLLFAFPAGIVSCLTPQALLLLPIALGAAGTTGRGSAIALALGLGLAIVLTGPFAGSLGMVFGIEAIWFRRLVCVLLILLAMVLMSGSMTERYPRLTGGADSMYAAARTIGGILRQLLLAFVVGMNWWLPPVGPIFARASLLAADTWNSGLAMPVLFVFGLGAAVPWILLGRIVRVLTRGGLPGMAGKRRLGLTLLAVAVLGISGGDAVLDKRANPLLPAWARSLATAF